MMVGIQNITLEIRLELRFFCVGLRYILCIHMLRAGLVGSDACPNDDQEVGGLTPAGLATFFLGD